MSETSPSNISMRKVRGITKGKNTARIVKHTDKRIPVTIDEQFNAFVGVSASKVATSLGIQLRKKAPLEGISKWSDIDSVIKDSIVQGVLDSFDIQGYGTDKRATEIINSKCQNLYRGWKCRAKRYFEELLAKGKDPYDHCFPSMDDIKWKYMIEHVWNNETFKRRSQINKNNRARVSYTHTMGSKSFASALYDISVKAKQDEVQPKFSEFFKLSHHSKKKQGWIDQRCEQDYAMLEQLESESVTMGELISPEELSRSVFGKKSYLKGLGPSIKGSSKKKLYGAVNSHDNDDLQAINAEFETLRSTSKEYEEKFISQEAMINSQVDMIGSLKKEIEDMKNRQMRFMNLMLGGGSLNDMSSSQCNNFT